MGYRSADSGSVTLGSLIAGAVFEGGVLSIAGDAVLTSALFDQPGGLPHLNGDGELVGPLIPRRLTLAALAGIVPAGGELVTTSDTNQVFLGDGSTEGGIEVGKTIPSILYDETGDLLYRGLGATAVGVRYGPGGDMAGYAAVLQTELDGGSFASSLVGDNLGMWSLETYADYTTDVWLGGNAVLNLAREGGFSLSSFTGGASIWADTAAQSLNLAGGTNAYFQDGSSPTLEISDAGFRFQAGPVILDPLTAAPANPTKGTIYCGTDGHFYGYDGSAWKQLDNA